MQDSRRKQGLRPQGLRPGLSPRPPGPRPPPRQPPQARPRLRPATAGPAAAAPAPRQQQHPRTAPAPAELPRSLENARAHGKEELANALIQSVVRDSPSGSGNAGTDDLPCALAIAVDQDNLEPDPDWGGDDDDEEEEMEKRRRQQLGSQILSLETTGLRPS